jgi:hypothetical protein
VSATARALGTLALTALSVLVLTRFLLERASVTISRYTRGVLCACGGNSASMVIG